MKKLTLLALAAATIGCICVLSGASLAVAATDPEFNAKGELVLPKSYREWVFVGMGLGMTYGPNARPAGQAQLFDNVYVTPEAYRAFLGSGKWPEGTMFLMEGRSSEDNQLLANRGTTQGDARFLEASVKDAKRFPDGGWGYFDFGPARSPRASVAPLPQTAECYSCHANNTAVENTFVQFYPELREVAQRVGTVKATFDPAKKF